VQVFDHAAEAQVLRDKVRFLADTGRGVSAAAREAGFAARAGPIGEPLGQVNRQRLTTSWPDPPLSSPLD